MALRTSLVAATALAALLASGPGRADPCNFSAQDFAGDWTLASGEILCSGTYQVGGTVTVPAGVQVQLGTDPGTGAAARVVIVAQRARIDGTLEGDGVGHAGGAGCWHVQYGGGTSGKIANGGGGGGAPAYTTNNSYRGGSGGGGGGYGGAGGTGGRGNNPDTIPGTGGIAFGTTGLTADAKDADVAIGSGGGGGSCSTDSSGDFGGNGGRGGAALAIIAKDIDVEPDNGAPPSISMNGAAGEDTTGGSSAGGGGGGGSGGTVALFGTEQVTIDYRGTNPALTADGAAGGDAGVTSVWGNDRKGGGGGGGAGGRIKIGRPLGCPTFPYDIGGGAGGGATASGKAGSAGAAGTLSCDTLDAPPIISGLSLSRTRLDAQDPSGITLTAGSTTNPYNRLIQYEFDCVGNGSYSVPQTSPIYKCLYSQAGTYHPTVRARDWNSIQITIPATPPPPAGATPGTYAPGTFPLGGSSTATGTVTVDPLPKVSLAVSGDLEEGGTQTFTATIQDPANDTFTTHWDFGDTSTADTAASAATTVTETHVFADNGLYEVTVTVTDNDGGSGAATLPVTIANVPPTVTLGPVVGPVYVSEPMTLSASATDPSSADTAAGFAYDFTVTDPSGRATVLHVGATAGNGTGVTASDTPLAPGVYQVSVTATDKDGGISAPATGSFSATPPAPLVTLTPTPANATVPESGTALQVQASWTDPLPVDESASFSYSWDWGDHTSPLTGQTAPAVMSTAAAHQYANSGTYTLTLAVTNQAGFTGTKSLQVTVTSVPPTVTVSPTSGTVAAMSSIAFQASATDPSPADTQAGFTYLFDWGDGTRDTVLGGAQTSDHHIYQDFGNYTLTVTATDEGGGVSQPAKASVRVTDVAPTVTLTGNQSGKEGDTLTFTATASDVSPADQARGFSLVWDFGDGTPPATGPAVETHVFEKAGAYTVTVTATDTPAGLSSSATLPVSIGNVAPTVDLGGDRVARKNVPISFSATVTDPGTLETFSYAWDFGDGATSTDATPTHTYAAYGVYVVKLTVTDSSGATGSGSISVHVNDLPPTALAVTISPAQPHPTDALTLTYTYSDPDGNPESGTQIVWTANGVAQPAFNGKTTLPAGVTRPNQVWVAQVTPSDGILFGQTVTSNSVTIIDHPPTVTNVTITPSEPRHADDLTLSYTYHDQDGSAEKGTLIQWTRTPSGAAQPQPMPEYENQTTVPGPLTKGDVWVATVTPSDGFLPGTPVSSAPVTVLNTPPQFLGPQVVAVPATGVTTEVTFTIDATDADGDLLTYSCVEDGTPIANGPTVTASFPVGTWQLPCSVSDGTDTTAATITVAVGDVPPLVNAGPDQVVDPGEPFVHATAADALGRPLTYQWAFESAASNPAPVLLTPNAPDTGFFARTAGDYKLKVTVSNGVDEASAETTVTVRNLPPFATIAPVGPAQPGDFILLDGSGSSDPNGDNLTYAWDQVGGPAATFEDANGEPEPRPTGAIAHLVAQAPGEIVVRLTVSDGSLSGEALATIDVVGSTSPMAPIAKAGPDQTVLTGETVQLDGSASVSLDGGALSFLWTVLQGPQPQPAIQGADQAKASFVATNPGQWTLGLTVTDGTLSSSDDLVVTVIDSHGNHRPVAHISPTTVNTRLAETVTLDGSNSTDQDPGTTLTDRWTQVSGPHVALTGANEPRVSFVTTAPGTLLIALVVNDGQVDSLPATAVIHVTNSADEQPIAKATGPATGYVGLPVALDGTQSISPSGGQLTYAWRQAGGPLASLDDPTSPTPTYVPEKPGTYVFELTVNDGELPSAPASVTTVVSQHALPIARIDAPDEGYVGVPVAADGSHSVATNGGRLSFAWTLEGHPEIALTGARTAVASFVPPKNGSYVLELVVNDGAFASTPVTKTLRVHNLPVAQGGCSQTGALSLFTLLGLLVLLWRRRTGA